MLKKNTKTITVLGIETSCDETAAAVLEVTRGAKPWYRGMRLLSSVVASQVDVHRKTGGVVPEVAAREHVKAMLPVITAALQGTGAEYRIQNVEFRPDAIAVTYGPGLITALMVGVETARTLAAAWDVPLVGVNHLEGHIAAAVLPQRNSKYQNPKFKIEFPALALLVSGGHTELILMRNWFSRKIIGATRDDAAGEAFDKVAKILDLPYPGGPAIEHAAKNGNPKNEPFTAPMLNSNDYHFSFSGIKTAVLYRVRDLTPSTYNLEPQAVADIAAGFQKAVVDVLVAKTLRAAQEYHAKTIILCGGVAANTLLRTQLKNALAIHSRELRITNYQLLIPSQEYCTDNAAMIAAAGALRAVHGKFTPWQKLAADPTLTL